MWPLMLARFGETMMEVVSITYSIPPIVVAGYAIGGLVAYFSTDSRQ